jgi:NAD-dependent DNA ligase
MKLNALYEKINSMVSLEIFQFGDTQKILEQEFVSEFLYLNNMVNDVFKNETTEAKFNILRIFDVYYRSGVPLISDNHYDGMYKIYVDSIKEPVSPIMFEPTINAWEKVNHDIPMGSLDKQTTIDEIEKWCMKKGIAGLPSVVSEKLDGISAELIFKNGKFTQAITRGDGKKGDDITENAKYFDGVVKELQEPWDCSIRGEVMITKDNLISINTILMSNGKDPLKNTRNGVAGLATKFKDRNLEILSLISFLAYDIQVFAVHDTGENVV